MRRADRLFRLVQLLRNRRLVTAHWLAGELGVSKRTIYRDIRDLEYSGVPIQGEAGVGYQLQRGYELPPLTFNAAEIEALVLGARIVATHGDEEIAMAARSAMEKVESVLPPALREVLTRTQLYAPGWQRAQSSSARSERLSAVATRSASATPSPTALTASEPCGPWRCTTGVRAGPSPHGASFGRTIGTFDPTG